MKYKYKFIYIYYLPTSVALIEECLKIPLLSIIKVPLKGIYPSSCKTPKSLETSLVKSDNKGNLISAIPPLETGVSVQTL